MLKTILIGSMLIGTLVSAHGADILLHNTGAGIGDGLVDPNYKLLSVPTASGVGPASYVVDSSIFPIASGDWMADSTTSKWIGPVVDMSSYPNDTGSGNYVYETTFDLTGLDPASASISGLWSTDNFGLDILINGQSTGNTHNDGASVPCYAYYTGFMINSGFVAGKNTLDFVVKNADLGWNPSFNPTGLRVEMTGTAYPLPEPVTGVVLLAGLLGLRRRNRTS